MKKVYIRADAGQAIGYGHFVRCLALAAMLRDEFECTIFTQTPNEFQEREASGICPLVSLPADDSKFDLFLNYLQGDEIVVLDNYFFTEDYIRTIQSIRPAEPNESLQAPQSVCAHRTGDGNPENAVCAHRTGGGCKVVRIQDFFNERSCADALIFPCRTPRQALLRPPFLTPQDAPDTHCSPVCPHQKGDGNPGNPVPLTEKVMANHSAETEICYKQDTAGKSSKWVVTFGGSDPLGLTDRFASELRERGFEVVTLRGGLSASEVAELFRSAEGVICSASSVCYEALACGCKVFAGWYVDNQLDFYNLLASRGLIVPLGDLRNGNLPAEFGSPVQSPSSQARDFAAVAPVAVASAAVSPVAVASAAVSPVAVASAATVTPPASGIAAQFRQAPRYYRTLFHSLSLEMVNYTDLSPEQSHAVWELRNREEIRRWMTNPEPFSFESHCRFIESLKTRSDREYYAFFQDGLLVGSYDLTDINLPTGTAAPAGSPESTPTGAASSPAATTGTADSGLFVNPEAQGHGIAKQMAARMDSRALWLGISTLHAVVLEDNERSLRFHKSIGYEPTVPNADSSSSGNTSGNTSGSSNSIDSSTSGSSASTTPGSSDNNTTATGPTLIHLTKLL